MRSLIVEYDPACCRIMFEVLRQNGECCFAENRDEGIEIFRQAWMNGRPIELVCLDIMMPNMEGTELLHLIHASSLGMLNEGFKQPKILLTTLMTETDTVAEYYHKLCDTYLVKPITAERLQEKLGMMGFVINSETIS